MAESAAGLPCYHPSNLDNDDELADIISKVFSFPEGLKSELLGKIIMTINKV